MSVSALRHSRIQVALLGEDQGVTFVELEKVGLEGIARPVRVFEFRRT